MNEESLLRQNLQRTEPELYAKLHPIRTYAQLILSRVPATFPEYTEHGWPHASSVERLTHVLFGDHLFKVLTPYEIYLLIIACWFHDVGMVGVATEDAETVRREHPERSAKFLLDHYSNLNLNRHEANTIGKICKSHGTWDLSSYHEEVLIGQRKIRLRLLCALVGLSDACDITSERAPELLYKHLKPGPESDSFWKTHLDIGGLSKTDGGKIWITAEYKSSKGKRLIEDVVSLIQKELDAIYSILQKYAFNLAPDITAQIDPSDPKLTEISFKKNLKAENILLILTKSLYKNNNVFIRELLQNAIDACRLREIFINTEERYEPAINILVRHEQHRTEFIIEDNGIGMDLYDIENQFAVPGSKLLDNSDFKNVRADKKVLTDRIIARFGIGVLSCFLVCDRVEIETKKDDSNPLKFVIDDLNSKYGFLESTKADNGTVIRAELKPDYDLAFVLGAIQYYLRENQFGIKVIVNDETYIFAKQIPTVFDDYWHTFQDENIKLRIGIRFSSKSELVVCQEGILVHENLDGVLPKYATGIIGFANLKASFVELTASRSEIEENEKYRNLQFIIDYHIQKLIHEVAVMIFSEQNEVNQKLFLNYLLELSALSEADYIFLNDIIVDNVKFELLNGENVYLEQLIHRQPLYYCLENTAYNIKRCKWLGQYIFSRMDILSNLRNINVSQDNVIFLRTDTPNLVQMVKIIKTFFQKNNTEILDVADLDNFNKKLMSKKVKGSSETEEMLAVNGICFAKVPSKGPVIDFGDLVILNLNNPEIMRVHRIMVSVSETSKERALAMAYFMMVAQRFDLAHSSIADAIDENTPPYLKHGSFSPSSYDMTMHRAQHLFYKGFYVEAKALIERTKSQGKWASDLKQQCVDKLNGN